MTIAPIPTNTKQDLQRGVDHIGICCVFFCHDGNGNMVMHKRSKNCRDEQGVWDNGGGSLEFGEDFEEAIRREVREEYGAEALDLHFVTARNVLRTNGSTPTHWIALIFAVHVDPSQVRIGEPDKMDEIGWFTKDTLPSPVHSQTLASLACVVEAGIL